MSAGDARSGASTESTALLEQALDLHRGGRLDEAAAIYRRLLADNPGNADASHLLGLVHFRGNDFDSAIGHIRDAIARDPQNPIYHGNLGNVYKDAGRPGDAVAAYQRALELDPAYAEIHNNLGYVLQLAGRTEEAIVHYRQAIASRPRSYRAHYNLGNALALSERNEEAAAAFREAARLEPTHAPIWDHLGLVLQRLGRAGEAEACFRRRLQIEPDSADAHHALALELQQQGRLKEAFAAYERAVALRPGFLPATASALWIAQRFCDWRATEKYADVVLRRAAEEPAAVAPFQLMSLPGATRGQLLTHARALAATIDPHERMAHDPARFRSPSRMRIGYLSSDFHGHPVAYLTAETFELHDRDRFEVILFSYGPDDGSDMRKRIEAGADRFIDLRDVPDRAAAQAIFDQRIQVLVDLKGYTADDRPRIAAHRPAPLQVNWLGFPGTMGADWIDYLVADPIIVPPGHDADYAEKIVRLPRCYQPNDRRRPGGVTGLTRAGCGLPETGFVFCSFNQSYKIVPHMFAVWMRLLVAVPGSVLWLLEENEGARANLRKEAQRQGVSEARLVFAPVVPLAQHLGRYALADLVLDTFPYTSHTTGSDALWAGCPMITIMGGTFASRVASSLLVNVGLPELIAHSPAEYEALALSLATDPPKLAALRQRLSAQREKLPLFDSPRFARALEAAYQRMWQRFENGKAPEGFTAPEF